MCQPFPANWHFRGGMVNWATVAFGPRGISLAPDIAVDLAFADYAAGRDPVLAKALALAR